jgi:hypothetical protein
MVIYFLGIDVSHPDKTLSPADVEAAVDAQLDVMSAYIKVDILLAPLPWDMLLSPCLFFFPRCLIVEDF